MIRIISISSISPRPEERAPELVEGCARLEGRPQARSCPWPSFETAARRARPPQDEVRDFDFDRAIRLDWGELLSYDLLLNAVTAGLLLGGFYAAVTVGISISFGILDIVNIAHPAFIILGSYIAYIVSARFGLDPIGESIIALPFFHALGAAIYQVYYLSFEKRGQESLRGLAFFFGILFITEV